MTAIELLEGMQERIQEYERMQREHTGSTLNSQEVNLGKLIDCVLCGCNFPYPPMSSNGKEEYIKKIREDQLNDFIKLLYDPDYPDPISEKERKEYITEFIEDMNSCPSRFQDVQEYRIIRNIFHY